MSRWGFRNSATQPHAAEMLCVGGWALKDGTLFRLPPPGDGLSRLLELGVLGFGLHQDRNVGVGVFPENQEILVRRSCASNIARQRIRTREAELCQNIIQ